MENTQMRLRIISNSVAGLAMLLSACARPGGEKENENQLHSTWQLDEKSHQAIVNHCVETSFADVPATFTLERKGEDLILQFNGQHHVWIAPADKKYFYSSQLLKSSVAGRFCNFQTEISIYFNLKSSDQSKIEGTWRATTCDYCPKVYFYAHRIN
ncbi:MAG: hypothetical protein Q8S18_10230 [Bacteroidales bacterium]|nr:hypothetical protein [Bacteroidales bacterium]